jgi:hypothetical protein
VEVAGAVSSKSQKRLRVFFLAGVFFLSAEGTGVFSTGQFLALLVFGGMVKIGDM